MHIHAKDVHISQMLVGFTAFEKTIPAKLHSFQDLIRKERISSPARGFCHMILQESVDQIDICSQQIRDARHLLKDEISMMDHEFQIERGEGLARPAWTRCLAI